MCQGAHHGPQPDRSQHPRPAAASRSGCDNGYGRRITVLEGNVWVTQDGDPRDIVLGAGEDFLLRPARGRVVSALDGDARIAREDGVDIGLHAR